MLIDCSIKCMFGREIEPMDMLVDGDWLGFTGRGDGLIDSDHTLNTRLGINFFFG